MLTFVLEFTFIVTCYAISKQELASRVDKDLHFVLGWAIGVSTMALILLASILFQ